MSDENKIKLAGLAFFSYYGKEYFTNEIDAIDFVKWNLKKDYLSEDFVNTCAKLQADGNKFIFGEMPVFYDEWKTHDQA